ncbi:MAG: carbohydrate kinase family protein [bacterium]|nr:carbohydrate kinase family protein [bacterium]
MNNIIICGALAYDRIMDFPGKFSEHILAGQTHILNLSFTVNGVKESFGGTGGNIAYSLAMLGERPKIVAVAGKDFGKYRVWLKKNKIDISGVKIVKDELTASAHIITDKDDNQITAFYPGSLTPLTPLLKGGENALAIVAPDTVARMREYAKIFRQNHLPYIFDPGQQTAYFSARELALGIKGAAMLIGNDYEIRLILNKLASESSARDSDGGLARLRKMVEILVITKGGQGAEIYNQNKKIIVPAAKKKAIVDPTGAGDAFRAGFIEGLVMNLELEQCAWLAMVVSAYAVENQGTQAHRFSWQEVEKRYWENYGEKI